MRKFVMSLLVLAFCVATVIAASSRPADSVTGWVIDSKCAANAKMRGNADCAKKCVADGAKLVVVAEKDDHVYTVDNQDAVADHAGHYVTISGKIDGDNLHVDTVTMLKQK